MVNDYLIIAMVVLAIVGLGIHIYRENTSYWAARRRMRERSEAVRRNLEKLR